MDMATDVTLYAAKDPAIRNFGTGVKALACEPFETTGEETAGSIVRVAKVNADDIPLSLGICNDASAGTTDVDVGLFQIGAAIVSTTGAFSDKDCLADGISLASEHLPGSELSAMSSITVDNKGMSFAEIAGVDAADYPDGFELGIVFTGGNTNVGTVSLSGLIADGI